MKIRGFAVLFPFVMAAMLLITDGRQVYAQAERETEMRLLTTSGTADVRARPDLAEVRLGVETEARTASDAREQNAARAGRIVDALKALRIPERNIQTSVFQIFPIRRFEDQQGRGEPPIVGYNVTNIITVRTEQLDLVPRIIDRAVEAGANRVEGVNFMLRDEETPRQTALRQAVANARRNAQTMAGELGIELIRVQSVQQGGVVVGPPPILFRGGAELAATPTPIFPGEVMVNASVTLTYVIQ